MARIICISKYPPLEGGIAAKTFWLCRALAEKGHTVHVVTNTEDIDSEYCSPGLGTGSDDSMKSVHIHRPQEKTPWHIPNDPHHDVALLNLALEVMEQYGADVIDTGYLIPYGLIGMLASQMTGVPFILRHGGSDLNKFVEQGIWRNLITCAVQHASVVITDREHIKQLSKLSNNVVAIPPYVPNPSLFKMGVAEKSKTTLALIGKANYYWRHKGWHRAVEIMRSLGDRFNFLVVSQGLGLTDFKRYAEENLKIPIEWRSFVHPMEMPHMLRSISGVFALQGDLPFPVFSNLVLEALYCGVAVISDNPDMAQSLKDHGLHIDADSSNLLVIPNDRPNEAAEKITQHFDQAILAQSGTDHREVDFATYIELNEKVLLERHLYDK